MEKELLRLINKKLGVIIALLSRSRLHESEMFTLRNQIKILSDFGLSPKEISEILYRSNNYINKELSKLRGRAKKRK